MKDCTCYHPNFLFNQFSMLERCALRNGNVHSAEGWRDVLDRYAGRNLGRGRGHDGARHPCCNLSSSSATAMRMTAIQAQAEQKQQDRSVRHAEKRDQQARKRLVRGPIRPDPSVCETTDTAQGEKRLFNRRIQAIAPSSIRPLGECRFSGLTRTPTFATLSAKLKFIVWHT